MREIEKWRLRPGASGFLKRLKEYNRSAAEIKAKLEEEAQSEDLLRVYQELQGEISRASNIKGSELVQEREGWIK